MQVAIIPARGGSKRIPRKNIKSFCGKPMIAWSIEVAKESGLTILSCSENGGENINEIDLNMPILIIIGSEKNGISNNLIRLSDKTGKIPISGKTGSLNASVAAGIILFEYNRQKNTN